MVSPKQLRSRRHCKIDCGWEVRTTFLGAAEVVEASEENVEPTSLRWERDQLLDSEIESRVASIS